MRLGYLLLVAAAGLLACSEAASINSNTAGTSPMSSDTTHTRFLRSARTTGVASTEADDEERAWTIAGGLIRNKAQTKEWLNSLLQKGTSVDDVKGILGLKGLSLESMMKHWNWNAFDRYWRLVHEKGNRKEIPYAVFGSGEQTKKNTHEVLLGWVLSGKSVEGVGKYLGVWGLPKSEQLLHQNWRAFKAYRKMFVQYETGLQKIKDQTQFAYFDKSFRGIDEAKETITKWAMKGYSIDYIATTLGLSGLSGAKLTSHINYRALGLYKNDFYALASLREANAKARAKAKALAKARAAAGNA
ncbi:hypothetical protein KRP22_004849 [Phytophthora ramorum]|uniref:RxLR effector protein Avr4 n=1 Tax=Phytophthora ramorum TaxID=164328 RepID=UPI0030A6F1CD|nr:RxLR effector protein Avr4 [Phytophthora ramorum]KAH7499866.1 RxLR effector protein Avr4 [Phytophthora ramorum]